MNKWVSVEDRLPEELKAVLVYRKNAGVGFMFYDEDTGWEEEMWSRGAEDRVFTDITHWMLLPEAPQWHE